MHIDSFRNLDYGSATHRIERFIDPKTKKVGALSREVIEFTLHCKNREEFDKIYRYFAGRKMVGIWNWEYDTGYYYIRNRKPIHEGLKYKIQITSEFIGRELIGRVESSPLEFKHRVIVQENFSSWSGVPISTWPLDSSGIGSQYESLEWLRKVSNIFNITSCTRPDGIPGNCLYTSGVSTTACIYVRGITPYSAVKIRATMCNNGGSDKGALLFRFKDDAETTASYKESLAYAWVGTALYLWKIENNVWTEIWSKDVGTTRPTVVTAPDAEDWFELGLTLIGPIIEIYWEGEYQDYIKYDRFQVGEVGFTPNETSGVLWVADLVVEKIQVPVYPLPASAYQVDSFVHDAVYTKDGWAQRVLAPHQSVKFWLKSENHAGGVVRVWDMRDGSFEQPHRWEEVTITTHDFKGDIFVENGICGIWYSDGRAYYMFNEHLNNVIMGIDTSAWWSQGYSLRNISPFKAYVSPSAMKGSLSRHFKWHEPNWFLHPQGEWNQNITYDFEVIQPEVEANFLLYGFKTGEHFDGTRIQSFNYDDLVMGVKLSSPSGKLKGDFKWFRDHSILEGRNSLLRTQTYLAKFSHGIDSHQLFLNNRVDKADLAPFNPIESRGEQKLFEKTRRSVVHVNNTPADDARRGEVTVSRGTLTDPQLIPLREDTDVIDPSLGAISKILVRRRVTGKQQTLGYSPVMHYTFDKGDADFDGSNTYIKDVTGNNPNFQFGLGEDIAFEPGIINEGIQVRYGATGQTFNMATGTRSGHSGGHVAISFNIKWIDNPTASYGFTSSLIYLSTSGTDLFQLIYVGSTDTFQINYNGTTIADNIPLDIIADGAWHSIVLCGGVEANVMHVFIADQHWSASVSTPTLAIDDLVIQNLLSDTEPTFAVDEFVVLDGGLPASIGQWIGSLSSLIRKTHHESKSEFSTHSWHRWDEWDTVFAHFIFNEGVDDIGPHNHTVTTTAKWGCLKDGGFSVGGSHLFYTFDPTGSLGVAEDRVYLNEGFTISWRGALINHSSLLDFRTASAADSIKIQGADGGLVLTVVTDSGTNQYFFGGIDDDYHEFTLLYNKGKAQLRVDDSGIPLEASTGNYAEDAKYLQGTQYFGGQIIGDLMFIKRWVTKGWGLVSHEENFWRAYHSIRYDDGTVDLPEASLLDMSRQSAILGFQELTIRLEAGNPFVEITDNRNQEKTLRIHDENDEWTYIIGELDGRDARESETTALAKELLHKYLFMLHLKTQNGYTVFNSPDAEDDVTLSASDEKFDYLTFPKTDTLIMGFFNWPLWHYLKEGGDADGLVAGASVGQGTNSFWTCAELDASGDEAYWDFYSPEFGSYLVMIRNRDTGDDGQLTVRIGDSSDDDRHWNESFKTIIPTELPKGYPNWSRPITYNYHDITAEPVKIRVTAAWYDAAVEVDYLALLPLGNGLHFPTDFIQQILNRNS